MRPRKKNRNLPACVYLSHGAYYLVKRGKWERLGTDLSTALAEYARRTEHRKGGMAELIQRALPHIIKGKAASTGSQYRICAHKLQEIFAEFEPHQVKPRDVHLMRRELSDTPNMTNRMITVLRLVFDYALAEQLVDSNPCVGVKRLKESQRDRLITPQEYQAIHQQAGERLQVIMDLLLLTGQRVSDVLKLRLDQLQPDGIYFRQQKEGARLTVAWTPELRAVVARAKALQGGVRTLTLLVNKYRKAPDYSSVKLQWDVARKAAGIEDVTLHDIRAMSGTHAKKQGKDPTALLGHRNQAMTARYLREKEVPLVQGPSIRQVLGVRRKR